MSQLWRQDERDILKNVLRLIQNVLLYSTQHQYCTAFLLSLGPHLLISRPSELPPIAFTLHLIVLIEARTSPALFFAH